LKNGLDFIGSRETKSLALHRHSQLDPIVWCMHQVLLRAKVPLSRLHGRMAKKKLYLLKLAASRPAQLCDRAP